MSSSGDSSLSSFPAPTSRNGEANGHPPLPSASFTMTPSKTNSRPTAAASSSSPRFFRHPTPSATRTSKILSSPKSTAARSKASPTCPRQRKSRSMDFKKSSSKKTQNSSSSMPLQSKPTPIHSKNTTPFLPWNGSDFYEKKHRPPASPLCWIASPCG